MKKLSLVLFLSYSLLSLSGFAQMAFTKQDLIGSWELDYTSAKGCVGGFVKPVIAQAQVVITFSEGNTYEQIIQGNMSNGMYSIDNITNDILFNPVYNQQSTMALKPYRMKVVSIEDDILTFLVQDPCGIYEQNYKKVKIPIQK